MEDADCVDQRVNPSIDVARALDNAGGLKAIGDIGLQRDSRASIRVDGVSHLVGALNIEVAGRYQCAPDAERERNRPSGAGASAGNKRAATGKVLFITVHSQRCRILSAIGAA